MWNEPYSCGPKMICTYTAPGHMEGGFFGERLKEGERQKRSDGTSLLQLVIYSFRFVIGSKNESIVVIVFSQYDRFHSSTKDIDARFS